MKRLLIILFSGVLAVVGSQAQVVRSGAQTLRSVTKATPTSGEVMRQL